MDKKTEAKLQKLLDKYNTLTELLKALSDKDGAEKLQELPELQDKYNTLTQLLVALAGKGGAWNTDRALYEYWEEWVRVEEKEDGTLLAVSEAPEGEDDCSCTITDPELIELINEMRPKPKKSVKKKAEKKVEKKKNHKNTTYLDVYRRVVDIMHDKTGYAPDRDIQDEENEEIYICLAVGKEQKSWSSAKAFVGGDPDETSIFDEVANLDARYEKLASRWDAEFVDSCSILGEVDVEDTSPAGIMKALDEAGL